MAGAKHTQGDAGGDVAATFQHQFADHGGEAGVLRRGGRAAQAHAEFRSQDAGLFVEVVHDFHVVRDEADGAEKNTVCTLGMQVAEMVKDVRLQPGLAGRAGAGLIDEIVITDASAFGHQTRGLRELGDIFGAVRHPLGNGVRGENEARRGGGHGRLDGIHEGLNEARVVEVNAELVNLHVFGARGGLRGIEILPVLAATGIAGECGGDKREDAGDAVGLHLGEGVIQQRVPVAIAEVDGDVGALLGEQAREGINDGQVLVIDRAFAAKVEVMLGDLFQPFAGYAAAAGDVFKKRHDVGGLVGPTKADEEDCVRHRLSYTDSPMRTFGLFLIALGLLSAQPVTEKYREASRKIIRAAMTDEEGMKKLTYLCDRIGHRLSGSEAFNRAVAWSAQQMKEGGLENVSTPLVKIPHWVRGKESLEIVSPVKLPLGMLGLGMTVGGDITAEVVGVKSFEELDKLGRAGVEGKIVLFHPPWVSYGVTGAFRRQGPSRAAKLGAKSVLIRSAGIPAANSAHTGTTQWEEGVTPIPAAALTEESLGVLERLVASGERVVVRHYSEAKQLPDADGANVIGELRGSEKPEEVVVISGHLDSWDVGQGAHDDASGCIGPLQALILLKQLGLRPKRTIRVVFWANEENGTRGGLAYRDQYKDQLKNHVIAIEMDGGTERPLGLGVTGGGDKALAQMRAIGKLLQPIGAGQVTAGGGGTDIGPIMREGVIGSGVRTVGKRYFEWHHAESDTIDKINPDDFRRNIAQLAVFAYVLADMDERLGQ